jgi:haloalkane dehalogenase
MTAVVRGSVWMNRVLMIAATALFVMIAVKYIAHPIDAVTPHAITLGSPEAITNTRVSGSIFLAVAMILVGCMVSGRLLGGLVVLAVLSTVVLAVRLLGLALDGPGPFTVQVLKPEVVLTVLSIVGVALERARQRALPEERARRDALLRARARTTLASVGMPARTVEIDGAPVSYVDVGEGPILLFVHGAPGWSFTWRGLVAKMRAKHRCFAIDLPGFGASPSREGDGSLRVAARVIERFVRTLDLHDVTLVANDTGGLAAFAAATRVPERFTRFVALSTLAFGLEDIPKMRFMVGLFSSAPARAINRAFNVIPKAVAGLGTPLHRWTAEERADYLAPFADPEARERCTRMLGSIVREEAWLREVETSLSKIADRPLLAVFGEKDAARALGVPKKFARIFSDFTDHSVRDAMHFAQEDDPEGVARAIETWMDRRMDAAAQ